LCTLCLCLRTATGAEDAKDRERREIEPFPDGPQSSAPQQPKVLQLEGPPELRTNTVSQKKERTYRMELRQEDMSLYMPGTPGEQQKNTPMFMPNEDMFMMARTFDISKLPAVHVVQFEPLVTRLNGMTFDDSIVHHIDLYLCTDELKGHAVISDGVPSMEGHVACDSMPWAYDRDGHKLTLPDHVGVAIGEGTPYTFLALEWHYLLARDGRKGLKNIQDHFTDHSGIALTITPDLRKHSAATFGLIDGDMSLLPGVREYEHVLTSDTTRLHWMLHADLNQFSALHPVAVHLHMHNHGRRVWVEHRRSGKKVGDMGHIHQYKGFGTDQSFFAVDTLDTAHTEENQQQAAKGHFSSSIDPSGLQVGDELAVHCVFDTRCRYGLHSADCEPAKDPIVYGLSHGQEMCGMLVMYYPHDRTQRFARGNIMGYMPKDLVTADLAATAMHRAPEMAALQMMGRPATFHHAGHHAGARDTESHTPKTQAIQDDSHSAEAAQAVQRAVVHEHKDTYRDSGCTDSSTWRLKGSDDKGCHWVAWESKPGSRCSKVDEQGVAAHHACRLACGRCEPGATAMRASHLKVDDDTDWDAVDAVLEEQDIANGFGPSSSVEGYLKEFSSMEGDLAEEEWMASD